MSSQSSKQTVPALQPINGSACFSRIGYDDASKTLALQFSHGGIYLYTGVKKVTVTRMLKSHRPGSYFHKNIKGQYRWTKVA